jgi:hypothetical protein
MRDYAEGSRTRSKGIELKGIEPRMIRSRSEESEIRM